MTAPPPGHAGRLLSAARIGGATPHGQPRTGRVALATIVSLAGSLAVDALLVALGEAVFPSTKGFSHFRFADYGLLTGIGVLVACAAWPVVTRLSFAPRWLFFRLALLVTPVLWLPDLWILLRHEPPKGVAVLAVMHVAIALVTYNALVHLAPARPTEVDGPPTAGSGRVGAARDGGCQDLVDAAESTAGSGGAGAAGGFRAPKSAWVAMSVLTGVELALGVAALLAVPFGRDSSWLPRHGELTYLLHAVVGLALAVGALAIVAGSRRSERVLRVASVVALVSLAVAAAGGVLAVYHSSRLAGAGLMLVGGMVAACAYLTPVVEAPAPGADVPAGSEQATLTGR